MEKNLKKDSAESLAKKEFWEKEFVSDNKTKTDKYWDNSVYANKKLQLLLKKYLPKGKKYKILEVGCYPGSKLIFFKKSFDYSIYGVEFVKNACTKTRENLKKFNVKGKIICSNFLNESFLKEYKSKFDIIFDFGFCEHFKNFNEIVKDYSDLLKKRGYLIIIMPNFKGLYKLFASKGLLKVHNLNIMNLKIIEQTTSKYFNKLFCKYVGKMYTDSAKESNMNLFIKNESLRNIFLLLFICLNKIMDYLPVMESKILSPYIAYFGQKKSTPSSDRIVPF